MDEECTSLRKAIEGCSDGSVDEVKELLKKGANPNEIYEWVDNDYLWDSERYPKQSPQNPLVLCIEGNKIEMAKLLIEAGANTCGSYYYSSSSVPSPLHHAIIHANIPMIELLVENGADLLLHEGLITAIKQRNNEVVDKLIKLGADLNMPNSKDEYPILAAVRAMNFPIVKKLVEDGVDLNRKNSENESALSISLAKQDFRTFKFLIESGADPALASDAIAAQMKTNPRLADYMKKIEKTGLKKSQTSHSSNQEAHMNQ